MLTPDEVVAHDFTHISLLKLLHHKKKLICSRFSGESVHFFKCPFHRILQSTVTANRRTSMSFF